MPVCCSLALRVYVHIQPNLYSSAPFARGAAVTRLSCKQETGLQLLTSEPYFHLFCGPKFLWIAVFAVFSRSAKMFPQKKYRKNFSRKNLLRCTVTCFTYAYCFKICISIASMKNKNAINPSICTVTCFIYAYCFNICISVASMKNKNVINTSVHDFLKITKINSQQEICPIPKN